MKVLLVADGSHFFLQKYLQGASLAFIEIDQEPLALCNLAVDPGSALAARQIHDVAFSKWCRERSPLRFERMFEVARDLGVQRIHVCFLDDAQALRRAVMKSALPATRLSVSIFGLSAFRNDSYECAYNELVAGGHIARTLVHSNNPDVTRASAKMMGVLDCGPVHYLHDPIYDDARLFEHDKHAARERLHIDASAKVVLYYGTFGKNKGADMLLEAARRTTARGTCFLFAGSLATAEPGFLRGADFALPHVRLDDRVIDERETGLYFRSADLIALPYRRHYEFDTSGVFVQSCLARRPMIVPNFAPFRQMIEQFRLGYVFRSNDARDLTERINVALCDGPSHDEREFDAYLAGHTTWTDFASTILTD